MEHEDDRSVSVATEVSAMVPPPSPLTGCYLLIVIGEPHDEQHKEIILQRLLRGFLSWDSTENHVDLEQELATLTAAAPEGEEARYGERLIQFASENLVTEVLVHPQMNTLMQCMRNLLSSFTRHRHIIHAGYTFAGNGSWIMQDGTFSLADFIDAFQENEVQRVIRAYENSISIDIHCSGAGGAWTRLPARAQQCRIRVNPADVMPPGSQHVRQFVDYVEKYVVPASLEQLLVASDVVGNIRFSHPTLYVFPGGQGDAALFGINGFNMLVDGGFSRKACWWDFARHLDRLDAVLLTRINNCSASGMRAVLRRKATSHVYPQIGHFFCNLEARGASRPEDEKDPDPLLVSLLEQGGDIMDSLRAVDLRPQNCYRGTEPVNLYHKVGHGTLDMYVLNPSKDSKYVREFLHKWHHNDQKLFEGAAASGSNQFTFPVQNLVSICALLVWRPANPDDRITRIMFPGSTPQHKIFEGLERLKHLEFLRTPICTGRQIAAAAVTPPPQPPATNARPIRAVVTRVSKERSVTSDKIIDEKPMESKDALFSKDDVDAMTMIDNKMLTELADAKERKLESVIRHTVMSQSDTKTVNDKSMSDIIIEKVALKKHKAIKKKDNLSDGKLRKSGEDKDSNIIKISEMKKSNDHKNKVEPKRKVETRVKTENITATTRTKSTTRTFSKNIDKKSTFTQEHIKEGEDKQTPSSTAKKDTDVKSGQYSKDSFKDKSYMRSKKFSPSTTPAKSTKEANNRRVAESKYKQMSPKREVLQKEPEKKEPFKIKREPISRRTKPIASPVKGIRSLKSPPKPKSIEKNKSDKCVKKRNVVRDFDYIGKDSKKSDEETSKSLDDVKQQDIDEREEQEIVREIEAVFNRDSENDERQEFSIRSDIEQVRTVFDDNKTEAGLDGEFEEEYLIIEKEEVEQFTEDSIKEHEQSLEKEDEMQKHLRDTEESEKKVTKDTSDTAVTVGVLKDRENQMLEVDLKISTSLEEKHDKSSEKAHESKENSSVQKPKDTVDAVNILLESIPDEKASTTAESGATTAPTLPEDERITLDDIKEDHPLEEEHINEDTKESILRQTLDPKPEKPAILSTKLDSNVTPIREIVKTPDEVADLPLHEEVDYRSFEEFVVEKKVDQIEKKQIKKSSVEYDAFKRMPDVGFVHEIKVPKDLPLSDPQKEIKKQYAGIQDDVIIKTMQVPSHAELVTVTPGSAPESPGCMQHLLRDMTSLIEVMEPITELNVNNTTKDELTEYSFPQFTGELRETHITTLDSPIKEDINITEDKQSTSDKIHSIPEDIEREMEEIADFEITSDKEHPKHGEQEVIGEASKQNRLTESDIEMQFHEQESLSLARSPVDVEKIVADVAEVLKSDQSLDEILSGKPTTTKNEDNNYHENMKNLRSLDSERGTNKILTADKVVERMLVTASSEDGGKETEIIDSVPLFISNQTDLGDDLKHKLAITITEESRLNNESKNEKVKPSSGKEEEADSINVKVPDKSPPPIAEINHEDVLIREEEEFKGHTILGSQTKSTKDSAIDDENKNDIEHDQSRKVSAESFDEELRQNSKTPSIDIDEEKPRSPLKEAPIEESAKYKVDVTFDESRKLSAENIDKEKSQSPLKEAPVEESSKDECYKQDLQPDQSHKVLAESYDLELSEESITKSPSKYIEEEKTSTSLTVAPIEESAKNKVDGTLDEPCKVSAVSIDKEKPPSPLEEAPVKESTKDNGEKPDIHPDQSHNVSALSDDEKLSKKSILKSPSNDIEEEKPSASLMAAPIEESSTYKVDVKLDEPRKLSAVSIDKEKSPSPLEEAPVEESHHIDEGDKQDIQPDQLHKVSAESDDEELSKENITKSPSKDIEEEKSSSSLKAAPIEESATYKVDVTLVEPRKLSAVSIDKENSPSPLKEALVEESSIDEGDKQNIQRDQSHKESASSDDEEMSKESITKSPSKDIEEKKPSSPLKETSIDESATNKLDTTIDDSHKLSAVHIDKEKTQSPLKEAPVEESSKDEGDKQNIQPEQSHKVSTESYDVESSQESITKSPSKYIEEETTSSSLTVASIEESANYKVEVTLDEPCKVSAVSIDKEKPPSPLEEAPVKESSKYNGEKPDIHPDQSHKVSALSDYEELRKESILKSPSKDIEEEKPSSSPKAAPIEESATYKLDVTLDEPRKLSAVSIVKEKSPSPLKEAPVEESSKDECDNQNIQRDQTNKVSASSDDEEMSKESITKSPSKDIVEEKPLSSLKAAPIEESANNKVDVKLDEPRKLSGVSIDKEKSPSPLEEAPVEESSKVEGDKLKVSAESDEEELSKESITKSPSKEIEEEKLASSIKPGPIKESATYKVDATIDDSHKLSAVIDREKSQSPLIEAPVEKSSKDEGDKQNIMPEQSHKVSALSDDEELSKENITKSPSKDIEEEKSSSSLKAAPIQESATEKLDVTLVEPRKLSAVSIDKESSPSPLKEAPVEESSIDEGDKQNIQRDQSHKVSASSDDKEMSKESITKSPSKDIEEKKPSSPLKETSIEESATNKLDTTIDDSHKLSAVHIDKEKTQSPLKEAPFEESSKDEGDKQNIQSHKVLAESYEVESSEESITKSPLKYIEEEKTSSSLTVASIEESANYKVEVTLDEPCKVSAVSLDKEKPPSPLEEAPVKESSKDEGDKQNIQSDQSHNVSAESNEEELSKESITKSPSKEIEEEKPASSIKPGPIEESATYKVDATIDDSHKLSAVIDREKSQSPLIEAPVEKSSKDEGDKQNIHPEQSHKVSALSYDEELSKESITKSPSKDIEKENLSLSLKAAPIEESASYKLDVTLDEPRKLSGVSIDKEKSPSPLEEAPVEESPKDEGDKQDIQPEKSHKVSALSDDEELSKDSITKSPSKYIEEENPSLSLKAAPIEESASYKLDVTLDEPRKLSGVSIDKEKSPSPLKEAPVEKSSKDEGDKQNIQPEHDEELSKESIKKSPSKDIEEENLSLSLEAAPIEESASYKLDVTLDEPRKLSGVSIDKEKSPSPLEKAPVEESPKHEGDKQDIQPDQSHKVSADSDEEELSKESIKKSPSQEIEEEKPSSSFKAGPIEESATYKVDAKIDYSHKLSAVIDKEKSQSPLIEAPVEESSKDEGDKQNIQPEQSHKVSALSDDEELSKESITKSPSKDIEEENPSLSLKAAPIEESAFYKLDVTLDEPRKLSGVSIDEEKSPSPLEEAPVEESPKDEGDKQDIQPDQSHKVSAESDEEELSKESIKKSPSQEIEEEKPSSSFKAGPIEESATYKVDVTLDEPDKLSKVNLVKEKSPSPLKEYQVEESSKNEVDKRDLLPDQSHKILALSENESATFNMDVTLDEPRKLSAVNIDKEYSPSPLKDAPVEESAKHEGDKQNIQRDQSHKISAESDEEELSKESITKSPSKDIEEENLSLSLKAAPIEESASYKLDVTLDEPQKLSGVSIDKEKSPSPLEEAPVEESPKDEGDKQDIQPDQSHKVSADCDEEELSKESIKKSPSQEIEEEKPSSSFKAGPIEESATYKVDAKIDDSQKLSAVIDKEKSQSPLIEAPVEESSKDEGDKQNIQPEQSQKVSALSDDEELSKESITKSPSKDIEEENPSLSLKAAPIEESASYKLDVTLDEPRKLSGVSIDKEKSPSPLEEAPVEESPKDEGDKQDIQPDQSHKVSAESDEEELSKESIKKSPSQEIEEEKPSSSFKAGPIEESATYKVDVTLDEPDKLSKVNLVKEKSPSPLKEYQVEESSKNEVDKRDLLPDQSHKILALSENESATFNMDVTLDEPRKLSAVTIDKEYSPSPLKDAPVEESAKDEGDKHNIQRDQSHKISAESDEDELSNESITKSPSKDIEEEKSSSSLKAAPIEDSATYKVNVSLNEPEKLSKVNLVKEKSPSPLKEYPVKESSQDEVDKWDLLPDQSHKISALSENKELSKESITKSPSQEIEEDKPSSSLKATPIEENATYKVDATLDEPRKLSAVNNDKEKSQSPLIEAPVEESCKYEGDKQDIQPDQSHKVSAESDDEELSKESITKSLLKDNEEEKPSSSLKVGPIEESATYKLDATIDDSHKFSAVIDKEKSQSPPIEAPIEESSKDDGHKQNIQPEQSHNRSALSDDEELSQESITKSPSQEMEEEKPSSSLKSAAIEESATNKLDVTLDEPRKLSGVSIDKEKSPSPLEEAPVEESSKDEGDKQDIQPDQSHKVSAESDEKELSKESITKSPTQEIEEEKPSSSFKAGPIEESATYKVDVILDEPHKLSTVNTVKEKSPSPLKEYPVEESSKGHGDKQNIQRDQSHKVLASSDDEELSKESITQSPSKNIEDKKPSSPLKATSIEESATYKLDVTIDDSDKLSAVNIDKEKTQSPLKEEPVEESIKDEGDKQNIQSEQSHKVSALSDDEELSKESITKSPSKDIEEENPSLLLKEAAIEESATYKVDVILDEPHNLSKVNTVKEKSPSPLKEYPVEESSKDEVDKRDLQPDQSHKMSPLSENEELSKESITKSPSQEMEEEKPSSSLKSAAIEESATNKLDVTLDEPRKLSAVSIDKENPPSPLKEAPVEESSKDEGDKQNIQRDQSHKVSGSSDDKKISKENITKSPSKNIEDKKPSSPLKVTSIEESATYKLDVTIDDSHKLSAVNIDKEKTQSPLKEDPVDESSNDEVDKRDLQPDLSQKMSALSENEEFSKASIAKSPSQEIEEEKPSSSLKAAPIEENANYKVDVTLDEPRKLSAVNIDKEKFQSPLKEAPVAESSKYECDTRDIKLYQSHNVSAESKDEEFGIKCIIKSPSKDIDVEKPTPPVKAALIEESANYKVEVLLDEKRKLSAVSTDKEKHSSPLTEALIEETCKDEGYKQDLQPDQSHKVSAESDDDELSKESIRKSPSKDINKEKPSLMLKAAPIEESAHNEVEVTIDDSQKLSAVNTDKVKPQSPLNDAPVDESFKDEGDKQNIQPEQSHKVSALSDDEELSKESITKSPSKDIEKAKPLLSLKAALIEESASYKMDVTHDEPCKLSTVSIDKEKSPSPLKEALVEESSMDKVDKQDIQPNQSHKASGESDEEELSKESITKSPSKYIEEQKPLSLLKAAPIKESANYHVDVTLDEQRKLSAVSIENEKSPSPLKEALFEESSKDEGDKQDIQLDQSHKASAESDDEELNNESISKSPSKDIEEEKPSSSLTAASIKEIDNYKVDFSLEKSRKLSAVSIDNEKSPSPLKEAPVEESFKDEGVIKEFQPESDDKELSKKGITKSPSKEIYEEKPSSQLKAAQIEDCYNNKVDIQHDQSSKLSAVSINTDFIEAGFAKSPITECVIEQSPLPLNEVPIEGHIHDLQPEQSHKVSTEIKDEELCIKGITESPLKDIHEEKPSSPLKTATIEESAKYKVDVTLNEPRKLSAVSNDKEKSPSPLKEALVEESSKDEGYKQDLKPDQSPTVSAERDDEELSKESITKSPSKDIVEEKPSSSLKAAPIDERANYKVEVTFDGSRKLSAHSIDKEISPSPLKEVLVEESSKDEDDKQDIQPDQSHKVSAERDDEELSKEGITKSLSKEIKQEKPLSPVEAAPVEESANHKVDNQIDQSRKLSVMSKDESSSNEGDTKEVLTEISPFLKTETLTEDIPKFKEIVLDTQAESQILSEISVDEPLHQDDFRDISNSSVINIVLKHDKDNSAKGGLKDQSVLPFEMKPFDDTSSLNFSEIDDYSINVGNKNNKKGEISKLCSEIEDIPEIVLTPRGMSSEDVSKDFSCEEKYKFESDEKHVSHTNEESTSSFISKKDSNKFGVLQYEMLSQKEVISCDSQKTVEHTKEKNIKSFVPLEKTSVEYENIDSLQGSITLDKTSIVSEIIPLTGEKKLTKPADNDEPESPLKEDIPISEASDSAIHSIPADIENIVDQSNTYAAVKTVHNQLINDKRNDLLEEVKNALINTEVQQGIITETVVTSLHELHYDGVSTPPTVPVSPLPKSQYKYPDECQVESPVKEMSSDSIDETVIKTVHVGDDIVTQRISTLTEKLPRPNKSSDTDISERSEELSLIQHSVGKLKTETDTITKVIKEGENVVTQTITTVTTKEIISRDDGTPQNIKTTIETTTLSKSSDGSTTTIKDTQTLLSECSSSLKSSSLIDETSLNLEEDINKKELNEGISLISTPSRESSESFPSQTASKPTEKTVTKRTDTITRDGIILAQTITITTMREYIDDNNVKRVKETIETLTELEYPNGKIESQKETKVNYYDLNEEVYNSEDHIEDTTIDTDVSKRIIRENDVDIVLTVTTVTKRENIKLKDGNHIIKSTIETVTSRDKPDGSSSQEREVTVKTEPITEKCLSKLEDRCLDTSDIGKSENILPDKEDDGEIEDNVEDSTVDLDVKVENVFKDGETIKRTITTKTKRETLTTRNENIKKMKTTTETITEDVFPDGSTETTKDVNITISESQRSSDSNIEAAMKGFKATGKIKKSRDKKINTKVIGKEMVIENVTTFITKEEYINDITNDIIIKTITETVTECQNENGSIETSKDVRTQIIYLPVGLTMDDWLPEELEGIDLNNSSISQKYEEEDRPLQSEKDNEKNIAKHSIKQRSPIGEKTTETDTFTKVIKEGDNEITQTINVVTTKEIITPEKMKITVETTTISKGNDGVTKTTKSTKTTISEITEEFEESVDTGDSEKSLSKQEFSCKASDFRSPSAASEELEHQGVGSPASAVSWSQISHTSAEPWAGGAYSDEEDGAGSPSSVQSQIPHSPRSNLSFELSDSSKPHVHQSPDQIEEALRSHAQDPMSMSTYGQLPQCESILLTTVSETKADNKTTEHIACAETSHTVVDKKVQYSSSCSEKDSKTEMKTESADSNFLQEADQHFERAIEEHKKVCGSDLISDITAKYEFDSRTSSEVFHANETKEKSAINLGNLLLDSKKITEESTSLCSATSSTSKSKTQSTAEMTAPPEEVKDPIESWGKPLGLPSPGAPPNYVEGKGTPKKQSSVSSSVLNKNRLNQEKSPIKKKISPVYMDLTYVPHHGNSYYSAVEFFKRVRARYYVFSGTEPSKEIYNALLDAKKTWEDKDLEVTIIPTYDTDVLGYWVTENEEDLERYHIDLSPSASRCTINLQDHETSCAAYRLEF